MSTTILSPVRLEHLQVPGRFQGVTITSNARHEAASDPLDLSYLLPAKGPASGGTSRRARSRKSRAVGSTGAASVAFGDFQGEGGQVVEDLPRLRGGHDLPVPDATVAELLSVARARLEQVDLTDEAQLDEFRSRLDRYLQPLISTMRELYGEHVSAEEMQLVIGDLGSLIAYSWRARPDYFRGVDSDREHHAPWWNSRNAVVAACYADRWAGGFQGVHERIPYLKELGVTHLRLLPPFRPAESQDDGGFSVASYREANPRLGTMAELAELGETLQESGISLMLDVVLSRTAPEHPWARAAVRRNPFFERFYCVQPDGPTGDAMQRPVWAQGPAWERMTPTDPSDRRRVRTSEQAHQWDLDWTNPRVFLAMAGEMLHVAGLGAQVLRIGSPWQLWRGALGGSDVYTSGSRVLSALSALLQIVAPSVILESNDPAEMRTPGDGVQVAEGLDRAALIWSSIATRDATMLALDIRHRGGPARGKGYLQPVRNHDALQWSFSDDVVLAAGLNPDAHRRFLGEFYSGRYEGSFAANPVTPSRSGRVGAAVCGTAASLAGVRHEPGPGADRVLLAHAVAFSLCGVPELWLGDELGVLDDPLWSLESGHESDPRWANRARIEQDTIDARHDLFSVAGRLYGSIRRMLEIRSSAPEFDGQDVIDFDTRNEPVLGYQRPGRDGSVVLCLANFSDWTQYVTGETLSGFQSYAVSLQDDSQLDLRHGVLLEAHGWTWIRCIPRKQVRD